MVEYQKPHLSFGEQVALLESRGLLIPDKRRALAELKRIGYYRLSAYWYPYRELPADGKEVCPSVRRRDTFVAGTSFDHALALYTFDEKLRASLMQGVEVFEIALRVKIGYHLGKIDRFGHLDVQQLSRYASQARRHSESGETEHEHWLRKYQERCIESSKEDFVAHFREKYDGELPVWVATELLNFGQLVRLLQFLPEKTQTVVAREFGVMRANDLASWCRSLNVVRNHCAHHTRLWNRVFTYQPSQVDTRRVNPDIAHLSTVREEDRGRVYHAAALLAGMIRAAVPSHNWPRGSFRTTMRKFPDVPQFSPTATMGFPEDWESQELWITEPRM